MPWCDTPAMAAHLAEISASVDPGAHAVLMPISPDGTCPPNSSFRPTSPCFRCRPDRRNSNPVENVWQFMRDNWLSNRVFKSYDDIVALCCLAWNNLIDRPWKIMSIGMRQWAHG